MADLLNQPPYPTVLKPYGQSLVDLAKERDEVVCFTGDLTRQCEIDLFAEAFPDRFIHAGMAEANMIGMAAALARDGFIPFVHTFGVFATRRPLDQIINAVAFPNLKVRILGFMPGVSSPGGPSHQAIDDVALMRGPQHDRPRRRRRGRGPPGAARDRRRGRPGLRAAQARRDPGDLRR